MARLGEYSSNQIFEKLEEWNEILERNAPKP